MSRSPALATKLSSGGSLHHHWPLAIIFDTELRSAWPTVHLPSHETFISPRQRDLSPRPSPSPADHRMRTQGYESGSRGAHRGICSRANTGSQFLGQRAPDLREALALRQPFWFERCLMPPWGLPWLCTWPTFLGASCICSLGTCSLNHRLYRGVGYG